MDLVNTETPGASTGRPTAGTGRFAEIIEGARDASPAHWGLAIVLLLMAYEWLISGLDKLFNRDYVHGLAGQLQASAHDNPNRWYVHFLNRFILPHAAAMAVAVEIGELLVVLGLVAGAVWWLAGGRLPANWARLLFAGVIAALVGSALMTANYYFLAGHLVPGLTTSDPFDEGLSIDGLLTLIALGLLVVHLLARRQKFEQSA